MPSDISLTPGTAATLDGTRGTVQHFALLKFFLKSDEIAIVPEGTNE
jgi:hypothetical protein